ncbi:MAG: MdtA/MuxA family multidrug efflux RND transporter periplasmic adaptor subunit [Proteobacteria bacterium]|nr:MdtA/MuxA family multidrug efflux RND transporter periplasmic adaptor subunit [Pseudomonadota bacterium]
MLIRRPSRVSKRILWIIGAVILVAAIATAIYMARWKDHNSGGGPGGGAGFAMGGRGRGGGMPVSVRVAVAKTGSIDSIFDALGTVVARNTVVVHARVDGQLVKIDFQEGREVRAGAVLAEIDPRPFDAALEQAQGQLARDQALLAIAKSDLDRYQTLLAQDSIAKQQVDDQASLVHQYQGAVQADLGAVANARLQREFTLITAPIAGRVGLRQVDVGNMVHAADANGVVILTETHPINVLFAVPADRAPEIARRWQAGQPLRVDAFDRDGKALLATGLLESADNVVDLATSTVKLKGIFDNKNGALLPNQFVNARITIATLENQVLIPAAAVLRGTPGTFVYLVGPDSTVSIRKVAIGATNGDLVAIASGLAGGDRVVVDGTDKLHEGSKIESAVDAPEAAAPKRKGPWPAGRPGENKSEKAGDAAGRGAGRRSGGSAQ